MTLKDNESFTLQFPHAPPRKSDQEISVLRELHDDACRDRDEATRQLRKLQRSLSWRATAPLWRVAKALHSSGRWLRSTAKGWAGVGRNEAGAQGKHLSEEAFLDYLAEQRDDKRPVFVQLTPMSWDASLFQRPQQMCAAIARNGAITVFASTGIKGGISGAKELKPDMWLITSRAPLLALKGCVFSFYSTDFDTRMSYVTKVKQHNSVLYEYIDHIDEAIFGRENVSTLQRMKEFAFSDGADLIVASAKALHDEAVEIVGAERVLLVPNGVDYSHFAPVSGQKKPSDKRILHFKKRYPSIAGYFGALAPWLWHEVINELTEMRPDIGFVFIGPKYRGARMPEIAARPNVLLVDAIPYAKLPDFTRVFDVCMIPFRPGEIARTTSPIKLFEYFAMEKPVIVTDEMNECTQFPDVISANSAMGFSQALDRCFLLSGSEEFRGRLRSLALANTWDQRAGKMLAAVR